VLVHLSLVHCHGRPLLHSIGFRCQSIDFHYYDKDPTMYLAHSDLPRRYLRRFSTHNLSVPLTVAKTTTTALPSNSLDFCPVSDHYQDRPRVLVKIQSNSCDDFIHWYSILSKFELHRKNYEIVPNEVVLYLKI
jgi:hypothetical protein